MKKMTEKLPGRSSSAGKHKVLVAFYTATGSTGAVAETIADALGSDLFEIRPENPYTDEDLDWNDDKSRINVEHEDRSRRDVPLVRTTPDDWSDYDTVFVGYPIWWEIAAWPVNEFIEENDFNGRTVIPFCTSSSSGMGESGDLLAKAAGSGNWKSGRRFSSAASSASVRSWVRELGL